MRKRNIKINVYLNEVEKKMLIEKSSKVKLSQSDFIRKLIADLKQTLYLITTSIILPIVYKKA